MRRANKVPAPPAALARPRPTRLMTMWTLLVSAILVSLAIAALPVRAQEAIPTAARALDDGAPPVAESGPMRLSDRIDEGPDVVRPMGPCGGPSRKADGSLDKTPHGEVWAGVGTHGYRDAGGVVCAPLGDHAAMSIAIDAGQIDGWSHRR